MADVDVKCPACGAESKMQVFTVSVGGDREFVTRHLVLDQVPDPHELEPNGRSGDILVIKSARSESVYRLDHDGDWELIYSDSAPAPGSPLTAI